MADRKRARCLIRGGLGWERVKVIGPGEVRRGEGLIARESSSAAGFGRARTFKCLWSPGIDSKE